MKAYGLVPLLGGTSCSLGPVFPSRVASGRSYLRLAGVDMLDHAQKFRWGDGSALLELDAGDGAEDLRHEPTQSAVALPPLYLLPVNGTAGLRVPAVLVVRVGESREGLPAVVGTPAVEHGPLAAGGSRPRLRPAAATVFDLRILHFFVYRKKMRRSISPPSFVKRTWGNLLSRPR